MKQLFPDEFVGLELLKDYDYQDMYEVDYKAKIGPIVDKLFRHYHEATYFEISCIVNKGIAGESSDTRLVINRAFEKGQKLIQMIVCGPEIVFVFGGISPQKEKRLIILQHFLRSLEHVKKYRPEDTVVFHYIRYEIEKLFGEYDDEIKEIFSSNIHDKSNAIEKIITAIIEGTIEKQVIAE